MKLYRNAVIMVVVLGLLIAAYAIFNKTMKNKQTDEEPNTTSTAEKIFDFDSKSISQLTVENKEGKFEFAKNNDTWTAVQPNDISLDSSAVDKIASGISYMTADRVIEENASDLAQYGLDKPVVVTAKLTDGSSKVLLMGNMNSTKDSYYVKDKESSKVCIISNYVGETFNVTKNSIRNKQIAMVKPEDVTAFTMEKDGTVFFSGKKVDTDNWDLTYPIDGKLNTSNFTPILEAVSTVSAVNFIEDNVTNLEKYGLDKPAYGFELTTAAGKTKFYLGMEKERDTEIYAKTADSNNVFTISMEPFTFLDKPLIEIVDNFVYLPHIDTISKITAEFDGQTVNCEIQQDSGGDTDKDKFFVNGKDATAKNEKGDSYFRKFYAGLASATLGEIDTKGVPNAKPDITITYTLKADSSTVKVEYVPRDQYSYYAVVNGKYTGKIVNKSKFDETDGLRDSYKNLMTAIDKK